MVATGTTTAYILAQASTTLHGVLKDLDPSLFQNIILGILAIFIPFAIVFLTDLLDPKKQRGEFEKIVFSEEVLDAKTIFWLSLIGIVVLAFFSGKDITIARKVIAIIFSLILIWLFWRPFKRILRYSEGYRPEYQIGFLKRLKLSRFSFGNKLTIDRMVRSWNSFWSEKSVYLERDFTKTFIDHIDTAIKNGKYTLAVQLGQTYQNNIEKRDRFSLGYEILPKLFEWSEIFWDIEQKWLTREILKEKLQNSFSSKYFPTFKKWFSKFLYRKQSQPDYFWNWHYFQHELFPAVAKALLQDGHGPFQLFTTFKKYIDDAIAKLETIEDKDRKARWDSYIVGYFSSFCPMYFDIIDTVSGNYDIWHHNFPPEWKVTTGNSTKGIPRVILHEFLEWTQKRIFKQSTENYDKELSEVVNGIFPNAHHSLFPAFLTLLFHSDIKSAVQIESNIFLVNTGISWSGEKTEEEIQNMASQQDESQKEETANIILEYFRENWTLLRYFKEDLTEKQQKEWEKYTEDQRKIIIKEIRQKKMQKALDELNSKEVIDKCKDSERYEHNRKVFIKLFELLLKNIK